MKNVRHSAFRTYVDALLDQLENQSDRAVLRYLDHDVTGRILRSAIFRYARALAVLGIGRGSLVALLAPNCPDALAIRYAANLIGAATMFVPASANAERRAALLARVQPTLLVAFPETLHHIPVAVECHVVFVGVGPASSRLDTLAQAQSDLPLRRRPRPDDLAVIVSSGGTTGVPKCSRRSFAAYSTMLGAANDQHRRQLINGPLAYLSQVLVDTTLIGGGTVVMKHRYDPAETLATIESERITDLLLVEPQLFETMDHPDVGRRDLSSLRAIAHIGGSAPTVLRQRAIARLGAVLTHMYGASETGLVSILPPSAYAANPDLLACAGRIRSGVEVRLRRADGTLARAGQCGNIEVRSAAVADGYYHQPVEEAEKFQDGWCLTGDAGFIDEAANLHVLGRAADVAEIDGLTIGPTHIEDALCRLPDVRYAVALAANNSASNYGWSALIEPWVAGKVDVARCMHRLDIVLGPLVANRIRIVVADRVPLTEQGKADRTAIGMILQGDRQSNHAPLQLVGNPVADRRLCGRQNTFVNEPQPTASDTPRFVFLS
ncbi:class I adenylate-forming enzyme family protein [Paraburkholderia sp. FT54]|uniref:class I adenylate-forming enzyme family protein n=1 Tax=Paraburkholderia sp. FT54 TaxID=3074437 RepID=UPI0028772FFC|nr:class I adenylate-forming enzyme family protein [Paraburkholderia sp. FT54]WNC91862.1 class I adenylate-forming enzyme family protein [Paraburkholderia sp. FT54]